MKFAEGYVLFCHVTTRIEKEKHGNLLDEKGGDGFPYIVYMDSEGGVIAKHDDERDAASFAKTGEKAKAYLDIKKKADKGDAAAKVDLALTQLELGILKPDEAQLKLKTAKLSGEQQARLDAALNNATIKEVLDKAEEDVRKVREEKQAQEIMLSVGKRFFERKKAGKAAPTGENEFQGYWILMMDYAESQKDAKTFEEALKALKGRFGQVEGAKAFFEKKDEALKKLQDEEKKAKEEKDAKKDDKKSGVPDK